MPLLFSRRVPNTDDGGRRWSSAAAAGVRHYPSPLGASRRRPRRSPWTRSTVTTGRRSPPREMPVWLGGASPGPTAKHGRSLSRRLRTQNEPRQRPAGRKQKAKTRTIRQMWRCRHTRPVAAVWTGLAGPRDKGAAAGPTWRGEDVSPPRDRRPWAGLGNACDGAAAASVEPRLSLGAA